MPRITELPALAQATSGDIIPIVDDAGNITKKVTANKVVPDGSIVTNQLANGAVTTAKIGDGQVSAPKIDSTTFPKFKASRSTSLNFPRMSTTIFEVNQVEINVGGGGR